MKYVEIARTATLSQATVLSAALRAHGFHPLEKGDGGLPGISPLLGELGHAIEVPEDEAAAAAPLARQLVADLGD